MIDSTSGRGRLRRCGIGSESRAPFAVHRAGRRDERRGASHPPGPSSRYASVTTPPSRFFGHVSEGLRRLRVAVAGEGGEARGGKDELVDRRFVVFLEVAQQPTGGDTRVPARIFAGDQ